MEEDVLIQERKEKALQFIKKKSSWITYIILAIITFISIRIRTKNIPGLKDITTGGLALGPDLDPYLFLRMAEYIVQNGKLFAIDMMRYVPLGFDTRKELILHPYMIAWFHKIAVLFGSDSVINSAIIYPVFMFALTVIAFFFLVKKIFVSSLGNKNANIIALISSFFLSIIPVLLPRTIAGIPEKESGAFFFLFLSFYLFLSAWKEKRNLQMHLLALGAGISTGAMALIWGGFAYIFVTFSMAMFIALLIGSVNKKKFLAYSVWLFSSYIIMNLFSVRYPFISLLTSITTGVAFGAFLVSGIHLFMTNTKFSRYYEHPRLAKIPKPILSLILSAILVLIFTSVFFDWNFVFHKIIDIKQTLITPTVSRLGVTVAENRQPFFSEWAGNFGPIVKGIPLFFWLFFFGSVYLFNYLVKVFEKRERIFLTASYVFFLFAIIFSRYSSTSKFNGTNFISLSLYALGFIVLGGVFGFFYYKYYKLRKEESLTRIDFGLLLLFSLFFLSIVSARGAVRLVMMLAPPAAIIVSFFAVSVFNDAKKVKDDLLKIFIWIIVGLVILSTAFVGLQFYNQINGEAASYAPNAYNQQWQKAMSWVRTNTPTTAVFGHWWDYGYWLQSIGKRATVLDGGNAIAYWNYMMGRYALTGTSNHEAAEFLYSHGTTHFLIDSTDIGKYSAYSSIGSNVDYDRQSWIPTFLLDGSRVQEKKDSKVFFYGGGVSLDEDITYDFEGERYFLPGGKAGIGAVIVEFDNSGEIVGQPEGIFVYQNQQYRIPLKYAYNKRFIEYPEGIESGIFLMPSLNNQMTQLTPNGALLYLSKRTVKSQLARLYLYKEDNPYFRLVHSEDDFLVANLKSQTSNLDSDIIYFQGIRGPIRIWEINYPGITKVNEEFLKTEYPAELKGV